MDMPFKSGEFIVRCFSLRVVDGGAREAGEVADPDFQVVEPDFQVADPDFEVATSTAALTRLTLSYGILSTHT